MGSGSNSPELSIDWFEAITSPCKIHCPCIEIHQDKRSWRSHPQERTDHQGYSLYRTCCPCIATQKDKQFHCCLQQGKTDHQVYSPYRTHCPCIATRTGKQSHYCLQHETSGLRKQAFPSPRSHPQERKRHEDSSEQIPSCNKRVGTQNGRNQKTRGTKVRVPRQHPRQQGPFETHYEASSSIEPLRRLYEGAGGSLEAPEIHQASDSPHLRKPWDPWSRNCRPCETCRSSVRHQLPLTIPHPSRHH